MGQLSIDSPIGRLVVRSENGALTALDWSVAGDEAAPSLPDPATDRSSHDPVLKQAAGQLAEWFAGQRQDFTLPLAPPGTAFQHRVWHAMSAIPFGATMTYGELARRLGTSPRPVGTACGRNPLPIIIPCHRVVGSDGKLHGYSGLGGLATKAWLLRHEAAAAQAGGLGTLPRDGMQGSHCLSTPSFV